MENNVLPAPTQPMRGQAGVGRCASVVTEPQVDNALLLMRMALERLEKEGRDEPATLLRDAIHNIQKATRLAMREQLQ